MGFLVVMREHQAWLDMLKFSDFFIPRQRSASLHLAFCHKELFLAHQWWPRQSLAAPRGWTGAERTMDIRILGVETVEEVTRYVIQVAKGEKVWIVKHRYSTFDDLRKVRRGPRAWRARCVRLPRGPRRAGDAQRRIAHPRGETSPRRCMRWTRHSMPRLGGERGEARPSKAAQASAASRERSR